MHDARIMFSVVITCNVSLSHSCRGKSLLVVARAEINASLNVWIALLAALTR